MKLLLHVCCAGCAIYTFKETEKHFSKVVGYFYNPNVHPQEEYIKRKNAIEQFANNEKKDIVYPDYNTSEYFNSVNMQLPENERCHKCWELRIKKTAEFAEQNGFDCFTTTLLISPYQNHSDIIDISKKAEGKTKFYYEDFRKGFKESHELLKQYKLYSQNYCGCFASGYERDQRLAQKERK